MTKAAIKAVYTDYKRVKSRKVHQIVFEVPSEDWPNVYRVLGEPSIETSDWFGIAAMNVTEPAPTPQEQGTNLAANAAIMLGDQLFQSFLAHEYDCLVDSKESANICIKMLLDIESKSTLNTDPQKAAQWRELRSQFEAWKLVA